LGALAPASALSVEPVNSDKFNVSSKIDLKKLTTANFAELLMPVAKEQASIVFYDFAPFTEYFQKTVIPKFQETYGIKVEYAAVDGDQAVQQMIAAKRAGAVPPADVFFMPNGGVAAMDHEGALANLPLSSMLPSAQDINPEAANVARGYKHGGIVVPFHRNQTAIAYDTRFVKPGSEPKSFEEILAYAKANPKKFAMTHPDKGGSGGGFLESAILKFASPDCLKRIYDYNVSEADAKAWANSACLDAVMAYFKELVQVAEVTNGNEDTYALISNGAANVATVWEDGVLDFIAQGLMPQSVRTRLLVSGEVGDGDGIAIPSTTTKLEAGLLFVDFVMRDQYQLLKLEKIGSRTARTKLDVTGALKPEVVERLVPQEQYSTLTRPRISGAMSDAAVARFIVDVLKPS
jgi:ABC-type uncharacterized transport system YnjBCD substrate-binding protein